MNSICRQSEIIQESCNLELRTFSLIPFCKNSEENNPFQVSIDLSTFPIFNVTSEFTIQGFVDKEDRKMRPAGSDGRDICAFLQEKKEQAMMQPKPTHKWCSVCKESFSDYLLHLQHKVHKQNLMANEFTKEIHHLVYNFKMTQLKRVRDEKLRASQTTSDAPRKRRIVENRQTLKPEAKVLFSEQESTKNQRHGEPLARIAGSK